MARGAAAMRAAVAVRLRALLAAHVPAVLSEVDGEINDLTRTAPSRRTATGELLCALLQSDPLCCALTDAEGDTAAAAQAAAREHYTSPQWRHRPSSPSGCRPSYWTCAARADPHLH